MKLKHQNSKNHYANLGKAAYCSVGFLILYTALNPTQNVYTQIMSSNNYDKLGFFCFALNSLFYGLGCLSASYIVDRLGVKFCLSISAISDTVWILAIIPPALSSDKTSDDDMFYTSDGFIYTTQILIQIIQGFCLGLKWVAGSKYISECATEETKGFYFSFYWGLFMVSMVLGSLIAAFVSIYFEQATYLLFMAGIAALSVIIFATLTKPIPQERYLLVDNDDYQSEKEKIILQKSDSLQINGANNGSQEILQQDVKHDQQNNTNHNNKIVTVQNQNVAVTPISFRQELKEVLLLIKSKRMLPLIPQLIWVGISIAVYSGIFVIIIIDTQTKGDDQQKFSNSMLALVSLGAGEIAGSILSGWMIDKYGNKKTVIMNIFLVFIQTCLMIAFLIEYKYSWLTFVLTFTWGFIG
ncbi:major facilitator superfamily protein [Stylonychia lemnae]|uniref:Major facilitator superfamily protein n=1 Tax=Stylonychia lemnae TaxID=5949 RepID=A0A077ZWN3_STYLE|nr:major facilitator superfamily protein [Stylonychia lemnae]|eukprot:CDW72896.1 major facilitator superfamily protein [Stylonychia lemnae]